MKRWINMERLIAERIEGETVLLEKEDLSHFSVPLSLFDFSVKEGDVLLFDGEVYVRADAEKDERRRKLLLMQKKLKEKSKNK